MTSIAFAMLNARRCWFVPEVDVTGEFSAATSHMLVSEAEGGSQRLVLYRYAIGGYVQDVPYNTLVDHRGNTLPASIRQPVVIPIPRNDVPVAVVGRPTDMSCRLARTAYAAADGLVDLVIVELGREGETP